jgi:hypothetical protein
MDPKEEWEKFLRGELPPGQLPISPWHNEMIRRIIQRHTGRETYQQTAKSLNQAYKLSDAMREVEAQRQDDWADAHLRATSSFTRAMSDKMLADCLGKKA